MCYNEIRIYPFEAGARSAGPVVWLAGAGWRSAQRPGPACMAPEAGRARPAPGQRPPEIRRRRREVAAARRWRRLLVSDGDVAAAALECRQRRLHRQDAVLGERRLDHLRVGALRQQELAVVLAVDAAAVRLLLVLGVHLRADRRTRMVSHVTCSADRDRLSVGLLAVSQVVHQKLYLQIPSKKHNIYPAVI